MKTKAKRFFDKVLAVVLSVVMFACIAEAGIGTSVNTDAAGDLFEGNSSGIYVFDNMNSNIYSSKSRVLSDDDEDMYHFCAYFKKPSFWEGNIHTYIYTAGIEREVTNSWPGDLMEYLGNDIYKYSFNCGEDNLRIMFNNGGVGGTDQFPGAMIEGFVFQNNGYYTIDGLQCINVIDPNEYRFYYSTKTILPGDKFVIGVDKLGGSINGIYYPGPGKVDWVISDRSVVDFIPMTIKDKNTGTEQVIPYYGDSTNVILEAKKFGETNITMKLNGVPVCTETVRVVLPDKELLSEYMDNVWLTNVMSMLQNGYNDGCSILNNYTEGDKTLISFMTALKEDLGFKVIGKELLADLGFTTSMQEDAMDDAVFDLMNKYLSTEEFLDGKISKLKSQHSKFSKLYKIAHLSDPDEKTKKLIKEIDLPENRSLKIFDKANKYVGKGLKVADLACTAVLLAQIDRDSVCNLMTVVELGGGKGSDEYKALSRLLGKIDDLDTYIIDKYFTDEMSDKLIDVASELLVGETLKTPKIIADFLSSLYEISGGKTADDFLKTYGAMNLSNFTKFAFEKVTNFSDAEIVFGLHKAAVQTFLDYCIDLADIKSIHYTNREKFKCLKATAQLHSDMIESFCSYEQMMSEAKTLSQGEALEKYMSNYTEKVSGYNIETEKSEMLQATNAFAAYENDNIINKVTATDDLSDSYTNNDIIDEDNYIFIPSYINNYKNTSIEDHEFEGVMNKFGAILPDTIESIGEYSFAECDLKSVILNNELQEIGGYAFCNCKSLYDVAIPSNVKGIGEGAFENCSSITYLELNSDTIGNNAFKNCESLSEVRIINRNTVIGSDAFLKCSEDFVLSGYKGSTAEKYAKENNITFEAIPEFVENITIVTPANKTVYETGEEVDTTGLSVKVKYKDGTEEIISDGWLTVCDTYSAGEKQLYIIYGEKSISYNITVNEYEKLKINLNYNKQEMLYGTGIQLKADVQTNLNYAPVILFSSNNPDVADVDSTGYVYSILPGKAIITARIVDTDIIAECEITVTNKTTFDTDDEENDIFFTPNNDNYYLFTLHCDNEDINFRIYDASDNIIAEKTGEIINLTTVLAKNNIYTIKINGEVNESDYLKIEEYVVADEVQILDENEKNVTELTGYVGDSIHLSARTSPENSMEEICYWESDNENIVEVDDRGYLTLKKAGIATIKLKTSHWATDECKIVVVSNNILGDTNNDSEVNIADALMISRYDAGLTELDESQLAVSDVNNDGEVNIADALMISRFDAGLITSL